MTDPFIQTVSGRCIDFTNPQPEDIDIEEIAHSLGLLCRFGGHCKEFYSVAEHSVRCAALAKEMNLSEDLQLEALLHDAAEAYIVDMPRPIKYTLKGYKEVETIFDKVIRDKYGLPPEMSKEVHLIDNTLLSTEKRDLMNPSDLEWSALPDPLQKRIYPHDHEDATFNFMVEFHSLTNKYKKVA